MQNVGFVIKFIFNAVTVTNLKYCFTLLVIKISYRSNNKYIGS